MLRFHSVLTILTLTACCYATANAAGETNAAVPESVPLTRNDMKQALDASKESQPRLPLPPLTEEETALIAEQKEKMAKGEEKPRRFGLANNGRMRAYYLSDYGFQNSVDIDRTRSGTNRNNDSALDGDLRTMMFWIVSRGNNCTYCLGHQESSLASRGVTDDQLAALDGDWSEFDPARRAAFVFAKKLSFEPYAIGDDDLKQLAKHYDDAKRAEIVLAVAGFNATNRWTGPLKIKQDVLFQFTRPTSDRYVQAVSQIAPLSKTTGNGLIAPQSRPRPALETRQEVDAALKVARTRTPRLPLAEASGTNALLREQAGETTPPQWMQLLAANPKSGAERISSYQAVWTKGTLDPRLKAIIAHVGARHDRAWYALGHAIKRLKDQGFTDDQIAALDRPEALPTPDREVVRFATTITIDPALITDDDFARLRKLYSDKQVAEIVYQTTQAAFFDRLTEAAGLQLEH